MTAVYELILPRKKDISHHQFFPHAVLHRNYPTSHKKHA